MNVQKCRELAEKIITDYNPDGLSPFPYENIEADKKNLKIVLIEMDQEDNNISGAITYNKNDAEFTIIININKPQTRQHFTIAHELGHYFLHQNLITEEEPIVDDDATLEGRTLFRLDDQVATSIEIEANNFAAALIMPENQVAKAWKELKNIEECAKIFNVSVLAMTIRLTKLELIKE